jgi:hypothetical protein
VPSREWDLISLYQGVSADRSIFCSRGARIKKILMIYVCSSSLERTSLIWRLRKKPLIRAAGPLA